MKNLNIGITIYTKNAEESVFVTGIIQNAMNLAKALMQSENNYNIMLFNVAEEDPGVDYFLEKEPVFNIHNLPIYTGSSMYEQETDLDLLISLGGELRDADILKLKNKGIKVVYYNCGSRYQNHLISVVYKTKQKVKGLVSYSKDYDAFWTIPQVVPSNFYHKVLHKIEPKTVPFIWDSIFLDNDIKGNNSLNNIRYQPSTGPKRISIVEVNREWLKYYLYPTLITEMAYRKHPELIKEISINNVERFKENQEFNHSLTNLDSWKTDKVRRYLNGWLPITTTLNSTDIVVSHQDNNPLNYSYLDILYLGYPLVHNASLIKDAGYYYNDWDGDEGTHQLITALKYHDKNIEQYEKRSKEILWKFSANNPEIIEKYDKLILDLFLKKR